MICQHLKAEPTGDRGVFQIHASTSFHPSLDFILCSASDEQVGWRVKKERQVRS